MTTQVQQNAAAHLAKHALVDEVWIGLNDRDVAENYVWTDGEAAGGEHFSNWDMLQPALAGTGRAVAMRRFSRWKWVNDVQIDLPRPYICAKEAQVRIASGGDMFGCAGGRWALGTPYQQVDFPFPPLPPTIVRRHCFALYAGGT
eukprot:SAG31_NODE_480_length_15108_cov_56.073423_9_plen_145_part_00